MLISATARAPPRFTWVARSWSPIWARTRSGSDGARRRCRLACARHGPRPSRRPTAKSWAPWACIAVSPAFPPRRSPRSWRAPPNWPASPWNGGSPSRPCAAVKQSSAACSRASPKAFIRAGATAGCCPSTPRSCPSWATTPPRNSTRSRTLPCCTGTPRTARSSCARSNLKVSYAMQNSVCGGATANRS